MSRIYLNPSTARAIANQQAPAPTAPTAPTPPQEEASVFDPEAGKATDDPFPDNITDYESMTFNELRSLCKERGLEATGTKVELIARLQTDDAPSEEIPISEEAATEVSDTTSEEAVSTETEGEVSESENSRQEQPIGEEE